MNINNFIPNCENLLSCYWDLSAEERNTALKILLEGVTYKKAKRNRWGDGQNATFELTIKPRIPRIQGLCRLRYKNWACELAHMEIICAIVHQLTRNLTPEEIEKTGFDKYYVDHTLALWPQSAGGTPWTATYFQSKGDPITDLHEDMAAEQKARTTYDNILRLVKDPEICDPIRFLREREIVHYQRFGESLRIVQDHLDSKNFYAINPEFDVCSNNK